MLTCLDQAKMLDCFEWIVIGYSGSIFPLSHIEIGLTHHRAHLYVRGREYTPGVPNKFMFQVGYLLSLS